MSTLTISGRADVAAAAAGVDDLSRSVQGLDDDVRRVDDAARTSGAGLESLGDASDNVSSKSSQAAGAMGDLAGGLDLIGASGAADALGTFAIGAQVAAGAGDVLNLVAETSVGRFVANAAASAASTTAQVAQTAATTAATVATTAFNAVMSLNPVALVVISVIALVAGLKLAYDHIGPVREGIDAAGRIGKEAVDKVSDAVSSVIGWFRDLPSEARSAWNDVKEAVEGKVDDAIEKVADLVSAVTDGPRDAASTVAGFFSDMFAPIATAIGWVEDLIAKIKSIDFDIPGVPGLRTSPTATTKEEFLRQLGAPDWLAVDLPAVTINVKADEQDRDRSMQLLVEALRDYFTRHGMTLSITE